VTKEPAPSAAWIVTVEFTIQAGFVEQFMERLAVHASESLRETGCTQFDVCVDPSDGHRVLLYEVYSVAPRSRRTSKAPISGSSTP
jgi:quinol monooxygenase YgiN